MTVPLATLLEHAAGAVAAVRAGTSLNQALPRVPAASRPGAQALAFHALRRLGAAEVLRRTLAPRRPAPELEALLLVALALLWPDDERPYAPHLLVDQAVGAARRIAPRGAGFVNAVLRRFLREEDARVAAARTEPLARWNHPPWWLDRLAADWPDDWRSIAEADNARPPLTLRVNRRRGSREAYAATLAAHGMASRPVGGGTPASASEGPLADALVLDAPVPVERLPGFFDGDVSVQDASAQLAAPLLADGLAAGARVLDACAAPGGKTAHLLELGDFDLLAIDRDPARLARVDETLERLRLHAETRAADAAAPAGWWDGRSFDAILLDAPCSASGIVRRHPDVRWLRRPGDIAALAARQDALLGALWPLLAPGGRLLFCTCSVFREEGERRIDAFLQRTGDAVRAASPPSPGHLRPLPDNEPASGSRGAGTAGDGFFLALLQRRPPP